MDLVGHSQGGMMPHYYIDFLGGAAKVHDFVALAPSNRGTTLDGLSAPRDGLFSRSRLSSQGRRARRVPQQEAGLSFLANLNVGGDTAPWRQLHRDRERGYDEVVTPYTSAFLSGPDVTNITSAGSVWVGPRRTPVHAVRPHRRHRRPRVRSTLRSTRRRRPVLRWLPFSGG